MNFDRNELHIQVFVDFTNGKLMSGHSSSSTFHDFEISSFLIIKNQKFENRELRFPKIRKFSNLEIGTLES